MRHGHRVLALAPDFDAATQAAVSELGAEPIAYPLHRTGLNPLADRSSLAALTRIFRDTRPDVVMGYTPKPAVYASLAAARCGVPCIVPMVTGLGYAFLDGNELVRRAVRQVSLLLYRRAFRASHGVIFHNRDDRDVLAGRGVIPPGLPVHVVDGSGVDLEHFAASDPPPTDAGIVFLMIARLVRYKGVAEFRDAAARVSALAPKARFLLVGPEESGPAGIPPAELAARSVAWLGPAEDVRPALAECHVYVLPSHGEGMPRTVLEALATGRPVVTTDARGCRETVRDGVNGFLVPIHDAARLADAMLRFIHRPEIIAPMGRESRHLAEQRFDVARVNRGMFAALGLRYDETESIEGTSRPS